MQKEHHVTWQCKIAFPICTRGNQNDNICKGQFTRKTSMRNPDNIDTRKNYTVWIHNKVKSDTCKLRTIAYSPWGRTKYGTMHVEAQLLESMSIIQRTFVHRTHKDESVRDRSLEQKCIEVEQKNMTLFDWSWLRVQWKPQERHQNWPIFIKE